MQTPILSTKLYIPPVRAQAVPRPRLITRLNEGLHRKLTLISAAAGSGKTTLISEWLPTCGRPAAWLSLDAEDGDVTRFLTYLVAALGTVTSQGEELLGALQSAQRPPAQAILTALLNGVAACPEPFILVLDDYHAVDAEPVDEAVSFLLDHLPPQMHLVITTRKDPHLPLARLRVRDQLTELRAADLRFTHAEAAGFLNQAMGLDLAPDQVAALEHRTEGWIAGLQMAALSMQGRADTQGFIRTFSGSHRFVLDYLAQEVLQRQPEHVRSFLLQTAILDRLSGPVCDAVTGRTDGSVLLEALERANLFIVPLDERREWYRYHHLFAEVLQARLRQEHPEHAGPLHHRASAWYEQNGLPSDAFRHAVRAGDFERAADLAEQVALTMLLGRQERTLISWLKPLPDEPIRRRPVLSVYYALALVSGDLDGAEARLGDAEAALGLTPESNGMPDVLPTGLQVVDRNGYRSLLGIIAIVRAYRAGALADVAGSLSYARRALAVLPDGDDLWRGAASTLLGLANWTSGDLDEAHRCFTVGMERLERADEITHWIAGAVILGNISTARGRLNEATRIYQQMLDRLAAERVPPVAADLYVGLSQVRREQGDLNGAAELLRQSRELTANSWISENRHLWYVAAARLKEAEGDLDGALPLLDEAARIYLRSPDPDFAPIAAIKARVWIGQGRLAEALHWIKERRLTANDPLSYLQEFEHITLARFLIAQAQTDPNSGSLVAATELLGRLLNAAEAGGRMGSAIEILVLQALAHEVQGNAHAALGPLTRALTLAAPEGHVRVFLDEGKPLANLLARLSRQGVPPHLNLYVQALLTAFAQQPGTQAPPAGGPNSNLHHLVEPLSERERKVLRLLASELSGPEMARELMVSLNTLRTHTKNIYRKLEVSSRRAAIQRAEKLDLL